jgi:calcium-activated chloride channel regulator 3/4
LWYLPLMGAAILFIQNRLKHYKHCFNRAIFLASITLLFPGIAFAGNSQYSRVRQISPLGKTLEIQGAGKPLADNASSRTVFDIVISIHAKTGQPSYPSGDNDATVDSGFSDNEQNAYEEIIQFFADGVCEMSNGAHHLGEVRIFKRGKRASSADIVWSASDWPRANVSGFGSNGKNIFFGDVFPFVDDSKPPVPIPYNALDQSRREGAGYTLAHEWGHYTLGLFDEYQGSNNTAGPIFPRKSDTPPPFPAIMNTQWAAANAAQSNRFRFLNLSQKDNFSVTTAQGRTYGKSGWDVVAISTDLDVKKAKKAVGSKTKRVHYTTLDDKGPASKGASQTTPNYVIELPAGRSNCRKDLKIIWMTPNVEMVLAIDTSASMQFSLSAAQLAAQTLVNIVPENQTTMGLLHFATGVTTDKVLTPIVNPPGSTATIRNELIASIEGYSASGSTQLFDGSQAALQLLEDFLAANLTKAIRMVFVLSDGADTNSKTSTENSVVNNYKGAAVALSTFGYGDDAPAAVLRRMARNTHGVYRKSPRNSSVVLRAFISALNRATDFQVLKLKNIFTGTGPGGPGKNASMPFQVDSTVGDLTVLVNFDFSDNSNVPLSIDTPSGPLAANFECGAAGGGRGENICRLFLDESAVAAAGTGAWTINATNNIGGDLTFDFTALTNPKSGESYDVTVETAGNNELFYPDPIPVTAAVSKGGRPITGVTVEATRSAPAQGGGAFASAPAPTPFTMNDQGIDGDAVAGDGIYTALLDYSSVQFSPVIGPQTISVTVSNPNNTAVFTDTGFSPAHGYPFIARSVQGSVGPNGEIFSPPTNTLVGENFNRSGSVQITLLDNNADNHGDDTSSATPLLDNNVPIKGRIDSAGDLDVFQIASPDTSRDLTVRVFNMALGMTPKVTVLDSSALNALASATVKSSQSSKGYLSLNIAKEDLSGGIFIIVEHTNPNASVGNFEISAGGTLVGDTLTPPPVLVSAVLPSSRSVMVNDTVTFFMTVLNATDNPAYDIGIILKTLGGQFFNKDAEFNYQITAVQTNMPVGTVNTPTFLDGRQGQTYVVSFRPPNVITPTQIEFDATSFNAAPITPIPGVNTLQFRASDQPVVDLIALAATLNNDGFVDIPGTSGTGVFAAATSNLGLGGTVTVKANTGSTSLPVTINLCQTGPAGACMASPSGQLDVNINNGATPTFGVFVTGSGDVANNAATNRIFLEFFDVGGVIVGSTSVAVKTVAAL